ncbi:MAG TPA: thioredoxin domain-containing protein [Campylobacterales bacterium]|nr:thioredoxin domain-containing protein [Campylobacterales bacterium]HHS93189.1 thioredoxin domain-containing protein [Campylobacterales bacterium]
MSDIHNQTEIHWYEYTTNSIEKAKNQNKAIFLFISTKNSKWSKKMAQESFENPIIIELLNERFIPIKVDAYERPEIERYYHKVYHLMNRQMASSPLSLFLTANLEPFYAGSYIPTEEIDEQLSLESLLRIISKKYITDYETLCKKGQEVLSFVNLKEQKIQATKLSLTITTTITQHVHSLLDTNFGGFGTGAKFPNVSTLALLLNHYQLTKETKTLEAVTLTLDNMANNGLYDKKEGGFYTYSEDAAWSKPYKVKTTYDNAQLIKLYLDAYRVTDNEAYKKIAFETIEYMLKQQLDTKLFALKDEGVITSWNALMVQALFSASALDEKYKKCAFEALESLLSKLYISGTLYHALAKKERDKTEAFLDDYSTLGETLITAYQHSLDESFLLMATHITNLLIEQYYEHGHWVYTTNTFKIKESIYDRETPSSVASSLSLLLSISSLVDNNYKKFVFKTLELHSYNLMRQPLSSPKLTSMLLRYLKDDIIIKANEEVLNKQISKREQTAYPYVFFKSVLENDLTVNNSHSRLKTLSDFNEINAYLESLS